MRAWLVLWVWLWPIALAAADGASDDELGEPNAPVLPEPAFTSACPIAPLNVQRPARPLPPLVPRYLLNELPEAERPTAKAPYFVGGTTLDEAMLKATLERAFARPVLNNAAVGFVVLDATNGEALFARNARTPMNPASVSKLITTATALTAFGSGYRFPTLISHDGTLTPDGSLTGSLYMQGVGDPSLVAESIHKLASELYLAGLRHVAGDVVADASYFDAALKPYGYDKDHSPNAYQAPTAAVSLNYSSVTLTVLPGIAGREPRVSLVPFAPAYLAVQNRATTKAKGRTRLKIQGESKNGQYVFVVSGVISSNSAGMTYYLRVPSPAELAASGLHEALRRIGITVKGKPRAGTTPASAMLLHRYLSPSLSYLVAQTNKWSNNAMAEMLLRAGGARVYGAPGTFSKGTLAAMSYIQGELGYPLTGIQLRNGSGLGDANRVPPELFARLLLHARRDWRCGPELLTSLALAGEDGTLRKMFSGTDAEGRLRGKTGSLSDVSAVAGLLRTKGGRDLAFTVVFEGIKGRDHKAIRSTLKEILLALVDWNSPPVR